MGGAGIVVMVKNEHGGEEAPKKAGSLIRGFAGALPRSTVHDILREIGDARRRETMEIRSDLLWKSYGTLPLLV